MSTSQDSSTLAKTILIVFLTVLITAPITAFTTWKVNNWLDITKAEDEARLFVTRCAFESEMDTHRLLIIGTTFDRKSIRRYGVAIINSGGIPQQDVRISVSNLGEIISGQFQEGYKITGQPGSEVAFSDFLGSDTIVFEIASIPAKSSFVLDISAYPSSDSELPFLSVRSSTMKAILAVADLPWVAGIKKVLETDPTYIAGKGGPVRQIVW